MTGIDVSVILPTYNRAHKLSEALRSVYAQEYGGTVEIIVVDDCSQDNTVSFVQQNYPDVHLISLKSNVGHGAARNHGLRVARGRFIAFLDSDDTWRPDYLNVQVSTLQRQPSHGIALSGVEVRWNGQSEFDSQTPDFNRYMSPMYQSLLVGRHFLRSGPSALLFSRCVFDHVGLFDERHRVGGDIDLYLRCLGAGFTTAFTELPLVIKNEGSPDQLTSPKNLRLREKSVMSRVEGFYSRYGAAMRDQIPPIHRIHANNQLRFAEAYFSNNYLFHGLRSCLLAAFNGYSLRALSSGTKQITRRLSRRWKILVSSRPWGVD
ncbi:glycosyltransferase family 2 protein [Synechococcus sp. BA-120 BA3]|nr:glycosyltransferase family 2 protein [Synechococcus sp. BA-120 BA3]